MDNNFKIPKGRQTIRKNGGRRTRLWELSGSNHPTVQKLEAAYLAGLAAMDRAEARHAANKADPRFTGEGVRDDLLKFALTDAVPALYQGQVVIKKARSEVAERKSKLKIEPPDKTDAAGARRREEIRRWLLGKKPSELSKYFASYGDNLPAEIAQAVIELPAEYSGVSQSRHDTLTERILNAQFGSEIAEIKQIEEAIVAAESTVLTARDEIRLEVGINDPAEFNALAAPVEAKQAAPWLRRSLENGAEVVRVVDLEKGVERQATPKEINEGIIAQTLDEYTQRKSA